MKKLLVALVATTMVSAAFADGHSNNMVRLTNLDNADLNRSVDLSLNSADAEDEKSQTHIALNYTRTFGQWQVGAMYRSLSQEANDAKAGGNTIGLHGIYNLDSDVMNSCYFGLHLMQHSATEDGGYDTNMGAVIGEDDSAQTIALEYGHRWNLGHIGGLHFTFAPSVMYAMTSVDYDLDADEDANGSSLTSLSWNWAKFDVFF